MDLAALRRRRALTQHDVAQRLGVDQSTISRLESGSNVQLSALINYLQAVGVESPRIVAIFEEDDIELDVLTDRTSA